MSCREFELGDLIAITAIPLANISASDTTSPVNIPTPTIAKSGFNPSLSNAIVIGQKPAVSGGVLIPIMRDTGHTKDTEADSSAGRLHTVDISCDVDDRDGTSWSHLLTLERTPRHLLLTFRGGAQAFCSASEDTYQCNVEHECAKTSVSFRIQNIMGIQLLV